MLATFGHIFQNVTLNSFQDFLGLCVYYPFSKHGDICLTQFVVVPPPAVFFCVLWADSFNPNPD